jgi:sortase (surface protein transpeptidase)
VPGRHRAPRRRRGRSAAVAVAVAVTAAAAGLLAAAAFLVAVDRPPTSPTPPTAAVAAPEARAAAPVRVRIPAIGVDAPVGPLEVGADGELPAPTSYAAVGWWRAGPEPGERGAAVLAGHVDSRTGPAVFSRLRELPGGARVLVDRVDGSTAEFAVLRTEQHPKAAFPTRSVYGATPSSELRLVTCGGSFDPAHGHYRDNVVVFAVRTAGTV